MALSDGGSALEASTLPGMQSQLASAHQPVFLHSSFRTGSTWLWTRFRRHPSVVAYCEPFHELHARLDLKSIKFASTDWRSNHPAAEPYFLEFLPLLNPGGGVSGFRPEMSYEGFFPPSERDGDITTDEQEYVQGLMASTPSDRTCIISCTRTLGRLAGLKRAFGGFHIVLTRNLLHQWFSYSNQFRLGNPYFVDRLLEILEAGSHDPAIRILNEFAKENLAEGDLHNYPNDEMFVVFVVFHIYLYAVSLPGADYILNLNAISRGGSAAMEQVSSDIRNATGLDIDLSDVTESVSAPMGLLTDRRRVERTIETLMRVVGSVSKMESAVERAGKAFLPEMWAEYDLYQHYAGDLHVLSAAEGAMLSQRVRDLERAQAEASSLSRQAVAERDAQIADLGQRQLQQTEALESSLTRASALEGERDALLAQIEQAARSQAEMKAEREDAMGRLNALNAEYAGLQAASQSLAQQFMELRAEQSQTMKALEALAMEGALIAEVRCSVPESAS